MTVEEQNKSDNESNGSKYADDFNFWRVHNTYYTLLVNIQLAINNSDMVLQMADFSKHIQNKLHGFLQQKKLPPPPPDIPVTIDEKPLTKVKEKKIY